jgi:hypothetical protein
MGGKSGGGGSPQPTPDEMFGSAARWNRLNQYTPYGSVEYSGPYNNIVTQNMSPEMLALMNQQMGMRGGAMANLMAQYGWNPTNIQNPSGDAAGGGTAAGGGAAAGGGDPYANIISSLPGFGQNLPDLYANQYAMDPNLDLGSLPQTNYNLDLGSLPGYENLDLSQLQAIPGEGDLEALRGNTEQALFERSRNLLDPLYNEQEARLNETYANRGMPVGAAERTDEFNRFDTSRSNAYQQAANEATIGGRQEVNDILSNAMGLRGQGLQEQMSLFGTGMQGRQQGLNELLQQAGLGMQGRQQTLSERLAQLGATGGMNQQLFQQALQGRGQLFNEQMGGRQQLYNELMGTTGASFGQLASILGLAPASGAGGDLSQFYGPGQVDVMGGYGVNQAANQSQSDFWSNIIGGLFGGAGTALGGYFQGG